MQPRYEHTQRSPLWLLLALPMVAGLAVAGIADEVGMRYAGTAFAAVFALLAASFATLTVRDAGEHLAVRFGPLPWFGTKIRYDSIQQARATRSRLIDGWGVHWIPGRGWTFNLWGFDCVEVTTQRGLIRIGSDDADTLARFLAARCAEAPAGEPVP